MAESEEKSYRIGEVAKMLQLEKYVIRFWEEEVPELAPPRSEGGQRLYKDEDIVRIRRFQQLVHEQGMTIDGARRLLYGDGDETVCVVDASLLRHIEDEIISIRNLLSQS